MMMSVAMLLILCFFILTLPAHALVRRYTFEVTNCYHARLCTNKTMLTINGQFPGPTMYARRGDLLIVDVINRANHNITIHWHGVKLPRYPWSDGPAYVTQCPITPGNRFTQRIILSSEEGTVWWHAHNEWFRNSVHGALVILPPKNATYPFPKPHAEFPIIIGEWWNADVVQVMEDFLRTGTDPQGSDAFLFNGLPGDLYSCSTHTPTPDDVYRLTVELGKTYLIRLVNALMDNIMFFRIFNHSLTVVGTDGAYTKPLSTDYIAIAPGQTVDFLFEANQPPTRYYMAARIFQGGGVFTEIPTTGYVEYAGIGEKYTPPASLPLPSFPPFNGTVASYNFTSQLRSLANSDHPIDVPKNVTHHLFYPLAVNLEDCPLGNCSGPLGLKLGGSINNVSAVLPTISYLEAYYNRISGVYEADFPDTPLRPYNYTEFPFPIQLRHAHFGTPAKILEYGSTVEMVFQSTSHGGGVEHPMHLHGHSFYVLGSGFGNFNASSDPANYNLVDPPFMETIIVHKRGWVAVRFKANNPGVWYLHCHFQRHFSWGMEVVFIVKDGELPHEKMLPPPPDMPPCESRSTLRMSDSVATTAAQLNA